MPTDVSIWLREQREARGWTRSEMARQLIAVGRARGDRQLPGLDGMCHNIYRWERGGPLSERYKLHYCRAFGIQAAQFAPRPIPEPAAGPVTVAWTDEATMAGGAARSSVPGGAAGTAWVTVPDGTARTARTAVPAMVTWTGPAMAHGRAPVSGRVPACQDPAPPDFTFAAYGEEMAPGLAHFSVEREVLMAAHEGSEHAERAERRDVGPATLEQLRADVTRLSAELMTAETLSIFLEMRRVRARIFRVLDQQLWPRDQAGLYFLLGCLADLMAAAASDLGYTQAAEELIRSGWAYAAAIDHRPLMAHLRLQHANIDWYNQPHQARDLAEDGLRYLDNGSNAAYLHLRYAMATAQLGNSDDAYRAISQGRDAYERDYTDDVMQIGGEFAISRASHTRYIGTVLTDIEGSDREANDELERAVAAYDAGPDFGEQHWFAGKPLASIDLANLQLRSGALDAATATLSPVLSLPPTQRITALTNRLRLVRTELHRPVYARSAQAQELDAQIEEFGRDTMPAGLHAATH